MMRRLPRSKRAKCDNNNNNSSSSSCSSCSSGSGSGNGGASCGDFLAFLLLLLASCLTLIQLNGIRAEAYNVLPPLQQQPPPVVAQDADGGGGGGSGNLNSQLTAMAGSSLSPNVSPGATDGGAGQSARQNGSGPHRNKHHHRAPVSSSSKWAPLEDLQDSSIKTRLGTITMSQQVAVVANDTNQPSASPSLKQPRMFVDFDRLIDKLLSNNIQQSKIAGETQASSTVKSEMSNITNGELNNNTNRTTMKFFRNNKTFGSVVFTSEPQQPRRLINCHLVDLEKHAPDVAIFESRYGINTLDIEFEDMMALIESCTDIARFRPLRPPSGLTGSSGSLSAPLVVRPPFGPAVPPILVVGRPAVGQINQQQHLTSTVPSSATSMSTFHKVMTGTIGNELNRLGPTIDDSNKLDIPQGYVSQPLLVATTNSQQQPPVQQARSMATTMSLGAIPRAQRPPAPANQRRLRRRLAQVNTARELQWSLHNHSTENYFAPAAMAYAAPPPSAGSGFDTARARAMGAPGMPAYSGELLEHNAHSHPASLLTQALAKVGETSKKLVLGEVTAPPSVVEGQRAGIKEALQEITSYDTTDLLAIWRGILPGTNWCGMGDRATSYNDLGFESDIDICCRAHDFCPIRLSAFSSGYGLFNWSFYTRSHCTCDQNFLNCLQRAESPLSSVVMRLYFTIMKTTCLHDNETTAFDIHQNHKKPSIINLNNGDNHNKNHNSQPQQRLRFHITSRDKPSNNGHSNQKAPQQTQQTQQVAARTFRF